MTNWIFTLEYYTLYIFIYLFFILHVSSGAIHVLNRRLALSLFASSLFILHYRILFKGAIVASKPIKALCLVTCKWFPEDYWLRLAASSHSLFTISNWPLFRHQTDPVQPSQTCLWAGLAPVQWELQLSTAVHIGDWWGTVERKKTPHLMGLQGFCSNKHKDTIKPMASDVLPWVNFHECVCNRKLLPVRQWSHDRHAEL